jgi:type II secretory pathway component PulK
MKRRSGTVLLAVLVVVVILSLAAYQFSEWVSSEYRAADQGTRAVQARALAESGIHYAAALLADPTSFSQTLGGNPYDQPTLFQGQIVKASERPRSQGRFSVVSPPTLEDQANGNTTFRYGVSDEAGKLNVNALFQVDATGKVLHDTLMKLPNMTEDIANSILDWLDTDDEPRSSGAESSYYAALEPSYRCKNGPLDSLEELLLVRGLSPTLLFGNDRNRNGLLDNDEDDGTGGVDLGWSAYLTIYSREKNVDSTSKQRIWLNDSNADTLTSSLTTAVNGDMAAYIVAYRTLGPYTAQPMAGTSRQRIASGRVSSLSADLKRSQGNGTRRLRSLASVYDLINTQVAITSGSGNEQITTVYSCPLNDSSQLKQLLPKLLDTCSTQQDAELPGRVNVNTAARAVLAALPSLSETEVSSILENRPPMDADPTDLTYSTPAWLLTGAKVSATTMKALERYITARTQVYRIQSVGHYDRGGPVCRLEAVIDTNGGKPRILYQRDLTELGKGFDLGTQR